MTQPITSNGPQPAGTVTIPSGTTNPPVPAFVPPTAPPPAPAQPSAPPPATGDQGYPANTPLEQMTSEQQVAYWKHHARKHEETAKSRADYDQLQAKAAQYDSLQAASMTDLEKANQRAQAAEAQVAAANARMVDAELSIAAAGRMTEAQRGALLDGLDRSKYLKADGGVDADKVRALVDGLAPAAPQGPGTGTTGAPAAPAASSLGQGARQGSPAPSVADGEALYRQLFPDSAPEPEKTTP